MKALSVGWMFVASAIPVPSLIVREPVPASPMNSSFKAACPGTRLEIVGHGLARPRQSGRVMVNGRRVRGAGVAQLERDLTNTRAVYRLVALCSRGNPGLQLQIYVGEADSEGRVRYLSGSAAFVRGALVSYRGLAPTTAESFWFR